jgi:nucleoside-diphosphate-sugar epimerase
VPELVRRHGAANVLASGRRPPASCADAVRLDVTDPAAVEDLVRQGRIEAIYHLAARLSAVGERDPAETWRTNVEGLRNVLEAARAAGARVFWPSSIAVFGAGAPRDAVPQDTVLRPSTMYGVTKVAGELLADYYVGRHRVDVRGVRYPGIVSSAALPGGGTTDYAVEMFHAALSGRTYTAFVREDCVLPMMYMPDCIEAALRLMDADPARLVHRNGFNVAAMSFSAGELAQTIRARVPGFACRFEPDERQAIADSWPRSLDDAAARAQWGWRPEFDLERMVADMLAKLRARGAAGVTR